MSRRAVMGNPCFSFTVLSFLRATNRYRYVEKRIYYQSGYHCQIWHNFMQALQSGGCFWGVLEGFVGNGFSGVGYLQIRNMVIIFFFNNFKIYCPIFEFFKEYRIYIFSQIVYIIYFFLNSKLKKAMGNGFSRLGQFQGDSEIE